MKALLLENIHNLAKEKLEAAGYQVDSMKGALNEDELLKIIKDYSILGIRSKTNVTQKVLEKAENLLVVSAFCIGTNQIDLSFCKKRGIAVFNAPFSNTRSVVELAIGEIIFLSRKIHDKSIGMHNGEWDKSASASHEIRGKKLGIIGYGNIGTQLSILAEALGMEVSFFDLEEKLPLGNAKQVSSMSKLLKSSDIISIHVDGREDNTQLIGKKEFDQMKDGVIFLNLSRGKIIDINALAENIKKGKVRGAGVDVFPYEPKTNDEKFESVLQNLPNTILTPHIGGSTEEAQANIADFVPTKIITYLQRGNTLNSVNFPELQLPPVGDSHRLIHIHKNVPGIIAKINNVLAEFDCNIVGQSLKTDEEIGYVITDVNKGYDKHLIEKLQNIENTIRLRILY